MKKPLTQKSNQNIQITKLNQDHKPYKLDESKELLTIKIYILSIQYNTIKKKLGQICLTVNWQQADLFDHPKLIEHGLKAIPEITKLQLNQNCKYIIQVTDGFWDVISIQTIYKILLNLNNQKKTEDLSQYILEQALKQYTNYKKDNMTIFIIDFIIYFNKFMTIFYFQSCKFNITFYVALTLQINCNIQSK
ncbi:unnamed protein product [Paramecium sonneborni]|uniref:PPM-type phosphatase domain-containing protein n=1 Tax=Paramecium sonneborni TaxID=65129 RepID=A0A8S1NAD3_9CILI|nr:unnamed protein product [Paramecium sonneborni]